VHGQTNYHKSLLLYKEILWASTSSPMPPLWSSACLRRLDSRAAPRLPNRMIVAVFCHHPLPVCTASRTTPLPTTAPPCIDDAHRASAPVSWSMRLQRSRTPSSPRVPHPNHHAPPTGALPCPAPIHPRPRWPPPHARCNPLDASSHARLLRCLCVASPPPRSLCVVPNPRLLPSSPAETTANPPSAQLVRCLDPSSRCPETAYRGTGCLSLLGFAAVALCGVARRMMAMG
jgi:hypothetical protein